MKYAVILDFWKKKKIEVLNLTEKQALPTATGRNWQQLKDVKIHKHPSITFNPRRWYLYMEH